MGYLSKELIEKCYLTMYDIAPEDTPSDGRVQLVSALRHFVSIDRYEKLYHSHCDGKITSDKAKFTEIVKEIVSISGGYVANFAEKINIDKDCKVSTNLFGGPSYLKSIGDNVLYSLPKNKKFPLINMQNGCLKSNKDYYSNIDYYLLTPELKVAFILWIVRNEVLLSLSFNSINTLLKEKYSEELVSCILPDEDDFNSYIDGFNLEDSVAELSAEDLLRIFNSKHNTITDPIDFMQLKEEIAKELSKDELTDILAKIFNNINVSAAGGVFTFMLGDKVVDKFSASELMEAASKKSPKAKYRYNAELSAAYEMFRFFKGHPELLYINCKQQRQGNTGNLPFQKIVYGAPGTGKSYGTDRKIHDIYKKDSKEEKEYVFRTTFHPDSDYSTFVGCYKPTKENSASYKSKLLNKEVLLESVWVSTGRAFRRRTGWLF